MDVYESYQKEANILFLYKGSMLAECPSDTYQIGFSSNCTETCPSNAPFRFKNLCLAMCPDPNANNECKKLREMYNPKEQERKTIIKCKPGFCLPERPYCHKYQCGTKCPVGTLIEDFSCVEACSDTRPYIFNNSCVTECPKSHPVSDEGRHCWSECPRGTSLYGLKCMVECPKNTLWYNSTCRHSCPSESPYRLNLSNTSICVYTCPPSTSISGMNCNLTCSRDLGYFLWNRTCVNKCPSSFRFVFVLSRRPQSYNIPVCLASCPDDTFIDRNSCVPICDQSLYIYNRSCVKVCPLTHQITLHRTCLSHCPDSYYKVNNTCQRACPNSAKYIYQGNCTKSCPSSHPFTSKATDYFFYAGEWRSFIYCVKTCNVSYGGTKIFNMTCVGTCPHDTYFLESNRSCMYSCPPTYPFYATVRQGSYYNTYYVNYCLKSCKDNPKSPGDIMFNMTCLSKCPNTMVLFNGTCIEKCPESAPFLYRQKCLTHCPKSLLSFNDSCFSLCPEHAPYRYERECKEQCPSHQNLTYKKEHNRGYVYVCVKECPGKTFAFRDKCFDQCPDPLASYALTMTCSRECPSSHRFRYMFTTNVNYTSYRCTQSCDHYIDGDVCLQACPKSKPYILNQTCRETCPDTYPYVEDATKHCLRNCTPNLITFKKTCYRKCPSHALFIVNNTCVTSCPKSLDLSTPSSKGHICGDKCISPYVEENNTCVLSCSNGKIIDSICTDIQFCPRKYRYTEHSARGEICREKCLDHQFTDNDKFQCVSECPKFHVNQICVEKCPETHIYTKIYSWDGMGNKCYEKCPTSTYAEGNKCVDFCLKGKYVVKNENICVSKCPLSHPFLNSMEECVTECGIGELINEDNKCIYESDCDHSEKKVKNDNLCVSKCPLSHPFLNDMNKCVTECEFGKLINEENKCIYESDCDHSRGYVIYNGKRCVRECPEGSFKSLDGETCISTTLEFWLSTILPLVVGVKCFIISWRICKKRKRPLKEKTCQDDESPLIVETHTEGESPLAGETSMEGESPMERETSMEGENQSTMMTFVEEMALISETGVSPQNSYEQGGIDEKSTSLKTKNLEFPEDDSLERITGNTYKTSFSNQSESEVFRDEMHLCDETQEKYV